MVLYLLILAGGVTALIGLFLWYRLRVTPARQQPTPIVETPPAPPTLNKAKAEELLDWLENQKNSPQCDVKLEGEYFRVHPRQSA